MWTREGEGAGAFLTYLFRRCRLPCDALHQRFNRYGKTYRVQAEAPAAVRQTPRTLASIRARPEPADGTVSALTRRSSAGPSVITVHGLRRAGRGSRARRTPADARCVERLRPGQVRAQGVGTRSGQSYRSARPAAGRLVFAWLVMVFLVLARNTRAVHPLQCCWGAFGTLGALLGVWLRGCERRLRGRSASSWSSPRGEERDSDVEFANRAAAQGRSIRDAALEAGRERLRPI